MLRVSGGGCTPPRVGSAGCVSVAENRRRSFRGTLPFMGSERYQAAAADRRYPEWGGEVRSRRRWAEDYVVSMSQQGFSA